MDVLTQVLHVACPVVQQAHLVLLVQQEQEAQMGQLVHQAHLFRFLLRVPLGQLEPVVQMVLVVVVAAAAAEKAAHS